MLFFINRFSFFLLGFLSVNSYASTFNNIALDNTSGLQYDREPSHTIDAYRAATQLPSLTTDSIAEWPIKPFGAPGILLFDYDADKDLDIYVTNGPGKENSLFQNQYAQTKETRFVDVAVNAGIDAFEHDGSGVCAGDIDNDGDTDLYILSIFQDNKLFVNQGNGTFNDITISAGLGGNSLAAVSCSMGDINNDGNLDIAIANAFDMSNQLAMFAVPFDLNHKNQLFLNNGDLTFTDVSDTSGFTLTKGFSSGAEGLATITWAIAMVDFDQDGDVDIIHADDNGGIPLARNGGVDRGYIHVFVNDGNGNFVDRPILANEKSIGDWMGLTFGDYNSDQNMDVFISNFGDYSTSILPFSYDLGDFASRWYLGSDNNEFTDPDVGSLVATPFGWGASTFDYDNDGDLDIAYLGGMSLSPPLQVDASNPGIVLNNSDGQGNFIWDQTALNSDYYYRENSHGVAVGDLNKDGLDDLVSVANFRIPEALPLLPYPAQWGGPFDGVSQYVLPFVPINETQFVWAGVELGKGGLAVEINNDMSENKSISIDTLGAVGWLKRAKVNRSGFGATVTVKPDAMLAASRPVVGGASHASQDSEILTFGVGLAKTATIDVLWPGGVKNRLYDVSAGQHITFPEIPCSYNTEKRFSRYHRCVIRSVIALFKAQAISLREAILFYRSAIRAYKEERGFFW